MNNIFCTTNKIGRRFDLKGSTQGRATDKTKHETVARKDNDFLKEMSKFNVGEQKKKKLMEIVKKDKELF